MTTLSQSTITEAIEALKYVQSQFGDDGKIEKALEELNQLQNDN